MMLSSLTLLVFCLPPDSGEKVALGITVLLAFSVFMLAIAEKMPETSESIPLIGKQNTIYTKISINISLRTRCGIVKNLTDSKVTRVVIMTHILSKLSPCFHLVSNTVFVSIHIHCKYLCFLNLSEMKIEFGTLCMYSSTKTYSWCSHYPKNT